MSEVCPNCGFEIINEEYKFCQNCGSKRITEDEPPEEKYEFCPNCGIRIKQSTEICPNCEVNLNGRFKKIVNKYSKKKEHY